MLDWKPEIFAKAFDVGIPALGDNGSDCVWTLESDAKGGRRPVVENVDGEFLDVENFKEGGDCLGYGGEVVFVVAGRGDDREAEPRKVGCDHVIFGGEEGDEVAELVRG